MQRKNYFSFLVLIDAVVVDDVVIVIVNDDSGGGDNDLIYVEWQAIACRMDLSFNSEDKVRHPFHDCQCQINEFAICLQYPFGAIDGKVSSALSAAPWLYSTVLVADGGSGPSSSVNNRFQAATATIKSQFTNQQQRQEGHSNDLGLPADAPMATGVGAAAQESLVPNVDRAAAVGQTVGGWQSQFLKPKIYARMGPTHDDQKPFCWSQYEASSRLNKRDKKFVHVGHPDCFDFEWTVFPH